MTVNLKPEISKDIVLVLHNVRSAQNVGSLFRTSDAFGVQGIVLCGYTPTPVDKFGRRQGEIAKTALGAEQVIPWRQMKQFSSCVAELKREGYAVIAVEQSAKSLNYTSPEAYRGSKLALVLGNEVKGLDPRSLALCDRIVEIPMKGKKESLNVSVAGALVLSRVVHP